MTDILCVCVCVVTSNVQLLPRHLSVWFPAVSVLLQIHAACYLHTANILLTQRAAQGRKLLHLQAAETEPQIQNTHFTITTHTVHHVVKVLMSSTVFIF